MSVAPGVCPNSARAASSGPVPARARTAAGRGDASSSERFPPRVVKSRQTDVRQTDRQFRSLPAPKRSADRTLPPIKLTVTLTELTEPGPTPNDERRMRPAESPAAEPNRQKRRAAKKSAPRPEKTSKILKNTTQHTSSYVAYSRKMRFRLRFSGAVRFPAFRLRLC